jgi:hypothetical protein
MTNETVNTNEWVTLADGTLYQLTDEEYFWDDRILKYDDSWDNYCND